MEIALSARELELVSELRKAVENLNLDEYENSDAYLITWVRYGNNDLKKAELGLRNCKKWRREYKIDSILNENWKELAHTLPMETHGVDRHGNPILAIKMDRDVKPVIEAVGVEMYIRYMMMRCESIYQNIRRLHLLTDGKINQFSIIADMDGFSFRQLTSPKAVSAYVQVTSLAEAMYPGLAKCLYAVNSPSITRILLNILKPFLSTDTVSRLKLYGTKRKEWKEALLKEIPEDQFPSFLQDVNENT